MKKGLLEDLKKVLDLAPQHRQHKTWAKCVETLQKVTADGRTVPGTGVSFCMTAPQPVRVPEWQQWAQKRLPHDSVFNGEIAMGAERLSSAGDYWLAYHSFLTHFGSLTLMFSNQQSGQGTSERLHQSPKRISNKFRNRLGGKVKEDLTEVKMSGMRKRAVETDKKKTYRGTDRVMCWVWSVKK
jgi:hypothetical protein